MEKAAYERKAAEKDYNDKADAAYDNAAAYDKAAAQARTDDAVNKTANTAANTRFRRRLQTNGSSTGGPPPGADGYQPKDQHHVSVSTSGSRRDQLVK